LASRGTEEPVSKESQGKVVQLAPGGTKESVSKESQENLAPRETEEPVSREKGERKDLEGRMVVLDR
jgi:hypothetical protein